MPQESEIFLRPHLPEHAGRHDLANLVVEHGLEVLPRGLGEIQHVVVDAEPALDDMLAATLVRRLLQGQPLPPNCRGLARCTALVREGQRPGNFPLEVSPQGIHLAIRAAVPGDLTPEDNAGRFSALWDRLGSALLEAAAKGVDPFTTSPVAQDPEFAAERTFLANDHTAYRQDLARGEEWQVSLPGGVEGTALLLRRPTTQLYQFWSRFAQDSAGGAHLLLAVDWGHGQWVFSTAPGQHVSLQSLVEVLQGAEAAHRGAAAAQNPWFDGSAFGHTLIAAPHGGSALPEEALLRLVKKWTKARPLKPPQTHLRESVLVATLAVLLVGFLALWLGRSDPQRHRGMRVEDDDSPAPQAIKGNLHLVSIGVSRYVNPKFNLTFAHKDAEELSQAFQRHGGELFAKVSAQVLTNDQARRADVIAALEALKPAVTQHDLVIVTVSGHGANLEEDDQFYFMPHDFNEQARGATGVFWDDFVRHLKLSCRVFLVMDTCHSGTITRRLRSPDQSQVALTRQLDKKNLPRAEKGMVVWAACLSQGTAQEHPDWKHGALTLALLEGLSGRYHSAKTATALPKGVKGAINLQDLDYYVSNRVKELVGGAQAMVSNNTGNLVLQNIPIAVRSSEPR